MKQRMEQGLRLGRIAEWSMALLQRLFTLELPKVQIQVVEKVVHGGLFSVLVFLTGIGQSVFKLELPKVQIRVLEIVFLSKNKEANSWVPP